MYQPQNKLIAHLQDFEIVQLLEVCSELFGTTLKQAASGAFIYMLRQRFNFTTDKKILDSCLEYAANPSQDQGKRFTPTLLAAILIMKDKEKIPTYQFKESSDNENSRYKKMFLEALYSDFDDYCQKKEPSRVFIWGFVAKKLKQSGQISEKEYENTGNLNDKRQSHNNLFKNIFDNEYKMLCLDKFHNMAMQGIHISEYIK